MECYIESQVLLASLNAVVNLRGGDTMGAHSKMSDLHLTLDDAVFDNSTRSSGTTIASPTHHSAIVDETVGWNLQICDVTPGLTFVYTGFVSMNLR